MAEELLKELKGGISNFTFIGKAMINDKSFSGEIIKDGKTWCHTDSSFGVSYGQGLQSFVRIYGGYKIDKPVLTVFDKDYNAVKIQWDERFDESLWEDLQPRSFYTAKIEKDEENKLITKRFLNALDFADYLSEHLKNDEDVIVTGEIEYSVFGDNNRLSKRYNVKGVYLNEEYKRNDEVIPKRKPDAIIRQTFLLDEYAIDKENIRELKKDGKTSLQLFVPQYISRKKVGDSYVDYKKTDPIPVPLTFYAKGEKDSEEFTKSVELIKNIWEQFFKVKGDTVREISLYAQVIEGHDKSEGEVVIDDKMQMLIDIGVLKKEDVISQVSYNGVKKSEFVYIKPVIRTTENGMELQIDDNKYAPEALTIPKIDTDDDDELGAGADLFNESSESDDDSEDKGEMQEDEFSKLFSDF